MAKYRFENFKTELVNPTIETLRASYEISSGKVNVMATLNANENKVFHVLLGQMENTENWGDKEVSEFAEKQLENFKV